MTVDHNLTLKAVAYKDVLVPAGKSAEYVIRHSISGNVTLQNYGSGSPNVPITHIPVTVELMREGQATDIRTVYLDSGGNYTIQNVDEGTYNIAFKPCEWLRKRVDGVVVYDSNVTGVDASLLNADLNGDNFINEFDYDVLSSNWYLFGDEGDGFSLMRGGEPLTIPPCPKAPEGREYKKAY